MKIDAAGDKSHVGNWDNVSASYTYAGSPEKPCLILNLELDVSAYQPAFVGETNQKNAIPITDIPLWRRNALNDEENFSAIYHRLEQNYDDLGIPGISGRSVSIFLIDTLLNSEKILLSPEAVQSVRAFASDCLIYVAKRAAGWDGGVQPARRIEVPFSLSDVSESDIIELSLKLSFASQEPQTISPPPETPVTKFECDIEDLTVSLSSNDDFVEIFEKIFHNEDWKMRIGKNASVRRSPDEKQSDEALAIRIGKKPDTGFYYEIQNQPVHYAPCPIAQTFESAAVSIYQYDTVANSLSGDKVIMNFAEIDLNAFAETAFSAIDNFFSPRITTAISKIDSLLAGDSETQEGSLVKFRRHKQAIAGAVAETLMPIFKSNESDEISLIAAREKFRQSLLIHLSNAFISNCATVFKASNVSIDRQKTGEISPGSFYGRFQKYEAPSTETEETQRAFENIDQDCLLSSGKIEYFRSEDGQNGGWRLPILFSSENDGQHSDFALQAAYVMTHLELEQIPKNSRKSEEQNRWIKMAGAPIITPVGHIEFPLLRKKVPSSPLIPAQTTDSSDEAARLAASSSSLSESTLFDYPLNYTFGLSARDLVRVSVSISNQKPLINLKSEAHPLFAALVQFVPACNYIYADFEKHADKLNASSSSTDPEVIDAKKALDNFELIFGELAVAYEQWVNLAKGMTLRDAPPSETNSFDIVLEADANGNARIDVVGKNPNSESPIPFLLEIQGYIQKEVPDKPDYATASYNYVLPDSSQPAKNNKDAPVNYLSYENALNMPDRTILLKRLNLFTDRNVSGQIQAFGNETVGMNEIATINDCFKLFSAPAQYENSDIFSLHYNEFDLSTIETIDPTLENYLDGFFASLLKEAAGIPIRLKMEVSFSYQLQASETDSARIVLPVILVPPIQVIPENDVSLPIISELAGRMIDWTKTTDPALESSSEYNIRLEVYGKESNHKMPLAIIDNVFIKTSQIIEKSQKETNIF